MSHATTQSISRNTALVPQMTFPSDVVYIRQLLPEECRQPNILSVIQSVDGLVDEVYGAFDQNGFIVGTGSSRDEVTEASIEHHFRPQQWLI